MQNKKSSSVENKFIAVTTMLVCLLAFPTAHSLFFDLVKHDLQSSSAPEILREIASPEPLSKNNLLKPTVVDFNCGASFNEVVQVQATHLRLRGTACPFSTTTMSIVNVNNGFKASVFKEGQGKFSTDFIDLVKGKNEIKITVENGGKSEEKSFHIERLE